MNQIKPGADWTFEDLHRINDEIETIGIHEMGYNIYENQIDVITSEQMLDAYSSIGMPQMYHHWSFGKSFLRQKKLYDSGYSGLAYEIVINSDPCVMYIMEQNTLMMQTLVIAHAGIGHNHFFKNNYLFKKWTTAGNIIDYLSFAKKFITKCEEKYGIGVVEQTLDAAHALMYQGVFKYPRKEPLSFQKEMQRKIDKALDEERTFSDIWRTLPEKESTKQPKIDKIKRMNKFNLPEENLLYFLETYSPVLHNWQREILRIVRNIAQYFYPQSQDKLMNEGCATWTHYTILNRMYDKGLVTDGAMLEFLSSHSNVVYQPNFNSKYYNGINPYALGFAMMKDIERVCNEPSEEDRKWFPEFAGCKDHLNVLKDAWANYRDESFIRQFLSPKVMRDFKLFSITDDNITDHVTVKNIHNEEGFRMLRQDLANQDELSMNIPEVEVVDVDMQGDRTLQLQHRMNEGVYLHNADMKRVMQHIANLWGYTVTLNQVRKDNVIALGWTSRPEESKSSPPDHEIPLDYLG